MQFVIGPSSSRHSKLAPGSPENVKEADVAFDGEVGAADTEGAVGALVSTVQLQEDGAEAGPSPTLWVTRNTWEPFATPV